MLYASPSESEPASHIEAWVPSYKVLAQNLSNQHAHGRESIFSVSHLDRKCKSLFLPINRLTTQ